MTWCQTCLCCTLHGGSTMAANITAAGLATLPVLIDQVSLIVVIVHGHICRPHSHDTPTHSQNVLSVLPIFNHVNARKISCVWSYVQHCSSAEVKGSINKLNFHRNWLCYFLDALWTNFIAYIYIFIFHISWSYFSFLLLTNVCILLWTYHQEPQICMNPKTDDTHIAISMSL